MTTSIAGAAQLLRAPTTPAETGQQARIFAVDRRPLLRSGLAGVARRAFDAGAVPLADLEQAAAATRFLQVVPRALLLGLAADDDPVELLERARRIAASVILVLDRADPGLIRRALAAGADGYVLVESVTPDELRATLEAAEAGIRAIPAELRLVRQAGPAAATVTDRCLDVLRLLAAGLHDDEIAEELGISTSSVRKHVGNAQQRLDARTRTQAVACAARQGLL